MKETFRLSKEELRELETLVRRVDFFDGEHPNRMVTCVGPTKLTVSLGGRTRTGKWLSCPTLRELLLWFHRFFAQAQLMTGLRTRDEVKPAVGALVAERPSLHLAQPRAFAGPLADFVKRSTDPGELLTAFQGLTVLHAPGPWASLVVAKARSLELSRRLPLLSWLVAPRVIASREHRSPLVLIAMSTLEAQVAAATTKRWRDQPSTDLSRGAALMKFLATERHEAAIPLIESLIREGARDDNTFALYPLGWMGEPALPALDRLLSSDRFGVRLSAVGIVPDFLGAGRWPPKENPLTDAEKRRIAKRLRADFLPRIREVHGDASLPSWARKKARKAIDAIDAASKPPPR